MKIANHRLVGVPFIASPNKSGFMNPTGIIMHYTAGFTAKSAISTLTNPRAKVSAHLVIDTDGAITQLVEFNRIAWHAGPSKLAGRSGCNQFTIGFEFVNPGYFRQGPGGTVLDWEGKRQIPVSTLKQYDLSVKAPNARLGGGTFIWPAYNRAQIEAGLEAMAALCEAYDIEHLAGHEDIDTRGWKTDPGPAFPMHEFQPLLTGKATNDRADGMTSHGNRMTVSARRLNVRADPSITARVLTVLSGGSEVVVLQDTGKWSRVEYAPGKQGWLADAYLKKG